LVLGESSRSQLGVDQVFPEGDLESATGTLDELDFDAGEGLFEFSDQTGRLGEVVSACAVFDAELHGVQGLG
jgi:hypothetical protein